MQQSPRGEMVDTKDLKDLGLTIKPLKINNKLT